MSFYYQTTQIMNREILQKYISGQATDSERQTVTEWIKRSEDNMREYLSLRKLHDITIWRMGPSFREKPRRRISLRTIYIEVAKIAAVIALVLMATHWFDKSEAVVAEPLQSIYVPAGQRAELMLADGTKVWLNARSTLTFPGKFNGDIRNVKLDGEGYFAVARNEKQPFIVETDKCNVRVLGTEFNVIAYTTDSIWETALLQGSVELILPGSTKTMKLEPNTAASLKGTRLIKASIPDMDYFLWREGLLCFNKTTVRDMIEKLKLCYGVDIIVNNTQILNNQYTGKFRTSDGVEHVLKVLKLNNKFTYTKNEVTNVITIN